MTTPNANAVPSPARLMVAASWFERGDGSPEQTAAVVRRLVAAFPDARLTMTTFIASRLTGTPVPVPSVPFEGPVRVEIETSVPNRPPTDAEHATLAAQRAARANDAQRPTLALVLSAHWYERGTADDPELSAGVLCHLLSAFPSARLSTEHDNHGRLSLRCEAEMPTAEAEAAR